MKDKNDALPLFAAIADRNGLRYSCEDSEGGTQALVLPRQEGLSFEITLTHQDANELCIYVEDADFSFFPFPQPSAVDPFVDCVEGLIKGTVKMVIADRLGSLARAALVRVSDGQELRRYSCTFWPFDLRTTRTIQNQASAPRSS